MPVSRLRPSVIAARERLAEGRAKLRKQHDRGSPGIQVCAHLTDLLDTVLLELYEAALADLWGAGDPSAAAEVQTKIALVPHGGYGRRDVAPFSDVDLMLLYAPGTQPLVKPLASRLTQDLCDAGLTLGFSLRTPAEACTLAMRDATVFTSLAESRYLGGSVTLFTRFMSRLRKDAHRRAPRLITAVEEARREEQVKYGESVYLLNPNLKRTTGGLRDIQMVRWIGFALHGESDLDRLARAGAISREDFLKLRQARDFLLRLRNEMHFHAGKSSDVLTKEEQVRLSALLGYQGTDGLLPVEQFMRDYFAHTGEVRYITSNFLMSARRRGTVLGLLAPIFSHQVERDFRVGPVHIAATRRGLEKLRGDLFQVLRLMDLANLYDKRIDHATWQAIRDSMQNRPSLELSPQTAQRFLSLLSQPAQLGELLRCLHQLRVLEKLVPPMAHARCLLQFNEYHQYTVDEHSIRAVEAATDFQHDDGVLGDVYRSIKNKRILHLAILLHDLGKGFPEDHSEVGLRLAGATALHLGLPEREAEIVKFLVHKHLLMSHLAQWRDIDDPAVVLQFAVEVGSPDVLKMLYVLTCADLAAVGPGVLNEWKLSLLTRLYKLTMQYLAGDSPTAADGDETLAERRRKVLELAGEEANSDWWRKQVAALSGSYLLDRPPEANLDDLRRLHALGRRDAVANGRYLAERNAVEYTVGTYESLTPGIFHKLCGALSGKGNRILSADIQTLADGLVLDRFYVHDLDYQSEPPPERLEEMGGALVAALKASDGKPSFRRVWGDDKRTTPDDGRLPTRVLIDNSTADHYTIIDIFAHDRIGLLYSVTRTLFELGLSVHAARIGTHLDQVVDVFYVTSETGRKLADDAQLADIRRRLLQAIEAVEAQPVA